MLKLKVWSVSAGALGAVAGLGSAYGAAPCFDDFSNNFKTYAATSLSASEASTSQILELMSQRRTEKTDICPTGYVKSGNICAPVSGKPAPKVPPKTIAAGPPDPGSPVTGAWAEGFADYERRTVSGTQTQKSTGVVFGIDRSMNLGTFGLQVGLLGGYSKIRQVSSSSRTETFDTDYEVTLTDEANKNDPPNQGPPKTIVVTIDDVQHDLSSSSKQTLDGLGLGFSVSVQKGRFFVDTVAKVDFFDVARTTKTTDSAGQLSATFNYPTTCISKGDPNFPDPFYKLLATQKTAVQETTLRNFVVGTNFGYRSDLPNGYWLEPTLGIRFTYSDFGDNASVLELRDGQALRLEAGAKVGKALVLTDGSVWSNAAGVFVYSDVLVNGFVIDTAGSSFESDEGKLRLRGVLQSRIDLTSGVSLYGEVGGRVGEDYWAVSGKLGGRVEW